MEDNYLKFKKVNEQETELYVYGPIEEKDFFDDWFGTGENKVNLLSLKDCLDHVDTPNLTVRINSYGGQVDQGLSIYGLLSSFKGHVKTIVDGFACSAASIIFMAGSERVVPENGLLMIHNARYQNFSGDSNAMKKASEDLEKITRPSLDIYLNKTKLSEDEIRTKMNEETWITSQEAYDWGFSTTKTRNQAMQVLEADFIHNLVVKNKELKNKLSKFENQTKNMIKEDAWASFFNTKNM